MLCSCGNLVYQLNVIEPHRREIAQGNNDNKQLSLLYYLSLWKSLLVHFFGFLLSF